MTIAPNNKPNCETLSWPFRFKFPLFTFDYEPEYGLVIDSDWTYFYTHTSRHIFSSALTQGNVSCVQMRLTHIVQIIWLARVLSSPASMRCTSLARFACVLQPSADGHARARSRAQCAEHRHWTWRAVSKESLTGLLHFMVPLQKSYFVNSTIKCKSLVSRSS